MKENLALPVPAPHSGTNPASIIVPDFKDIAPAVLVGRPFKMPAAKKER